MRMFHLSRQTGIFVAVWFSALAAAAAGEICYPLLDARWVYANEEHADKTRYGTVGTESPTNAACHVDMDLAPAWVGDLGQPQGVLRFRYRFRGPSIEEYAAIACSFGRVAVDPVKPDGQSAPSIDLHDDSTANFINLAQTRGREAPVDAIGLTLRQLPPLQRLTLRVAIEDATRRQRFVRYVWQPTNALPCRIALPLGDFNAMPGFDLTRIKTLRLVIEETHVVDRVKNPIMGGFDVLAIDLVNRTRPDCSAAALLRLSDRDFVRELARRDFESLWRIRDAATGATLDRTLFRDLIHWGSTGWLLGALPGAVEQGWVTPADAEARALSVLRFLDDDARWGDEPVGRAGNSRGVLYRFGGIDPSALNGPLTGTRKIDTNNVNSAEASTIDTALLLWGVATCGAGFSGSGSPCYEIRARAGSLLRRTHWDDLLDPSSRLFRMAWKPLRDDYEEAPYHTPAAFGGYWASCDLSGSRAQPIDFWTAEGAMIAVLAAGSETHATIPEVWYSLIRKNRGGVVLTFPGAWFTYVFLHSTYLGAPLGPDPAARFGILPVDWLANCRGAYVAYTNCLRGFGHPALPDAVELPNATYEAQGLPDLALNSRSHFAGTITPYSLQMAIGLDADTARSAIAGLRRLVAEQPALWDPLVGMLDSYHPDLSAFPATNKLTRLEGPWIQQQKWPLNCGAALLAELNYLSSGGVWRTALKSAVISNGVTRIYGTQP